jgi:hypothetical protein
MPCSIARLPLRAALAALALSSLGCGSSAKDRVSCTSDADCVAAFSTKFTQDLDLPVPPQCCTNAEHSSGICMLPAPGCDSGFRYVFAAPQVGDCVKSVPMCQALPVPPDMSAPDDLSTQPAPDLAAPEPDLATAGDLAPTADGPT